MKSVTDFHVHAYPDRLAARAVEAFESGAREETKAALDGTVGDLLRSMGQAGVERSVICSIATRPEQVAPILDWSLSIRSDRIVPFGSVHPDCEDVAAEVARIAESGLAGIKLHPMHQGFAADEARMWPCYRAMAERGLILVLHCGQDLTFPPDDDRACPRRVLVVHRSFPDLALVAAHLGGWRQWEEVAHTLAGTDVYLETSFSLDFAAPEVLADILNRHSTERILFGTDSPWQDQGRSLALARQAFPDPSARRLVLGANADRLLRVAAGRGGSATSPEHGQNSWGMSTG